VGERVGRRAAPVPSANRHRGLAQTAIAA
jgi:hypothetical protein